MCDNIVLWYDVNSVKRGSDATLTIKRNSSQRSMEINTMFVIFKDHMVTLAVAHDIVIDTLLLHVAVICKESIL